ncbi:MAG: hypothetical protein K6U08_03970 [Firmicutes bacterium]|nr:hypothetical protein [Bacillota bacterium]
MTGWVRESLASAKAAESPLDLWLGLFLVLYSGGFLSIVSRLGEYESTARVGAFAWMAIGLALLAAGGLVLLRGLVDPISQAALATTAVLYAFRGLYGTLSFGNPFGPAGTFTARLGVALGLAADLGLVLAAGWLLVVTVRGYGEAELGRRFTEAGLVFLAAFLVQTAVGPLVGLLLYLVTDASVLRALVTPAGPAFLLRLLPTLVKGLAGAVGLGALWRSWKERLVSEPVVWTLGLWSAADLLLVTSLWASWVGPASPLTPPLGARLRTTVFIILPALALAGLARTLLLDLRGREGAAR